MILTAVLKTGIKERAIRSDPRREKVTVNASSLKSWPAMPITNIIGRNMATVVSVDANIGPPTSPVALLAAFFASLPSWRCLNIFSITTTALSTSMPTPSASPPSDIILRLNPLKYIKLNVTIIDMGMESVTIKELLKFLKKTKSTKKANMPPCRAASRTPFIEFFMNEDWS